MKITDFETFNVNQLIYVGIDLFNRFTDNQFMQKKRFFFFSWHKGEFLCVLFCGSLLGPSGATDNCSILTSDWLTNVWRQEL